MKKDTPDFIVIGAEKCGTTWLYNQLLRHSEIGLPSTKELHFFNSRNSYGKEIRNYQKGIEWYKRHFKGLNKAVIGEITPLYLCDSMAVDRIHRHLVNTKFIVILRNPVDRALSQYNMALNKGHRDLDLLGEIERDTLLMRRGLYSQHLKIWFRYFERSDFLILKYEDLFTTASSEKICKFLDIGLENDVFRFKEKIYSNPVHRFPGLFRLLGSIAKLMHNSDLAYNIWCSLKKHGLVRKIKSKFIYTGANKIRIENSTLDKLLDYYAKDIRDLEQLLNWDLAQWKQR